MTTDKEPVIGRKGQDKTQAPGTKPVAGKPGPKADRDDGLLAYEVAKDQDSDDEKNDKGRDEDDARKGAEPVPLKVEKPGFSASPLPPWPR